MLILYLIELARIFTDHYEDAYMYLEDAEDEENLEKHLPIFLLKMIFSFWVAVDNFMINYIGLRYDYDEGIYLCRPARGFLKTDYEDIKHFEGNWPSYHERLHELALKEQIWNALSTDHPDFPQIMKWVSEVEEGEPK